MKYKSVNSFFVDKQLLLLYKKRHACEVIRGRVGQPKSAAGIMKNKRKRNTVREDD